MPLLRAAACPGISPRWAEGDALEGCTGGVYQMSPMSLQGGFAFGSRRMPLEASYVGGGVSFREVQKRGLRAFTGGMVASRDGVLTLPPEPPFPILLFQQYGVTHKQFHEHATRTVCRKLAFIRLMKSPPSLDIQV